jgi:peptidyl-prolyl cis-trans isomerase A (cyclophilin A)
MHSLSPLRTFCRSSLAALLSLGLLPACQSGKEPEPEPTKKPAEPAKPATTETAKAKSPSETAQAEKKPRPPLREPVFQKVTAKPVATVPPAPGDPLKGKFTMEDALKGLPSQGKLFADIHVDGGKLECELWPDKAPITVANFVGLARGIRPWKKGDSWVKKPIYDGSTFHRIIKGFMIQGGDPNKDGSGGPGYAIPDEIWEDAQHKERGLLCMANAGPNTNGSQFFIMDGAAPHLDGGYTIFGKCGPDELIEKLASTPTMHQRTVDPPKINKVVIRRAK